MLAELKSTRCAPILVHCAYQKLYRIRRLRQTDVSGLNTAWTDHLKFAFTEFCSGVCTVHSQPLLLTKGVKQALLRLFVLPICRPKNRCVLRKAQNNLYTGHEAQNDLEKCEMSGEMMRNVRLSWCKLSMWAVARYGWLYHCLMAA